ncbi:histidine kinase [Georgenia sp. TF02-10]|uniref:sensor histidine kinase n=1 Tax=Georgenia sp. TF02-10 TaxID=2917725 RepID=UPI001FA77550|nr:histidine kinase [Georgenia sp. TF02-10]UNX55703.1 histidine kinase [Georgenia sp. TF02-10]
MRLVRAVLGGAALRGGVFLLGGGIVCGAYLLLGVGFAQMYADPTVPVGAVTVLLLVTAAIALAPPFLHPVSALEVAAARALLDADLPEESPPPGRARGAAWYLVHLLAGTAATLALLTAVPVAVALVLHAAGPGAGLEATLGPLTGLPATPAVALAAVLLLVPPVVIALLGEGLRRLAPRLLGPSAAAVAAATIARLESDKRALAARNHLARELHDTVGHALTVTTLQATAAARAFDRDPGFARSALGAIEETGRAAVADLDRVLGLLRAGEDAGGQRGTRPLADVPALVAAARATGARIDLDLSIGDAELAAVTSREAFAVVQEGLTNALRHGDGTVGVAVVAARGGLEVTVRNGLGRAARGPRDGGPPGGGPRGGGRGLAGLRDRVALVGGTLTAGPEDGRWVLRAWLPGWPGEEVAG